MAQPTTGIGVLNNLIREELPNVIHESLPAIAPIFDRIKNSSIDVQRNTGIGRGWKVLHTYETGVAGLIETAIPTGPTFNTMIGSSATDAQAHMLDIGDAAAGLDIFPAAAESPHTADMKRELSLHKQVGNFSVPVQWMQADALSATQIKKVARDIQAVGKNKAIIEASSFFSHTVANASGYQNQVLGRVSAIAEDATNTDFVLITIDEQYGRICNFRQGMSIDIVADSSGTLQDGVATDGTDVRNYTHTTEKYVRLIVVDVDFLAKKVLCSPVNTDTGALPNYGSSTSGDVFATAAAADDWIVLAKTSRYTGGSRPQCSWGLNDFIKSSGKIMGGAAGSAALDLAYYSQFKSSVVAVNSPLTDDVLNRYIAGYLDAYPGMTIDTIITTQGVNQQWLQQPQLGNGRFLYDRTGKSLKMKGGWSEVTYEWGGRVFNYIVSPMCLSKTLYAVKFADNNITRYVPPTVGGTSSAVGGVEFLAPLGGHSGIFKIAHSSGGKSQDLVEAPFWMYNLIAPLDPKGIKLTGLTEATMV
jgi:hypothetical protein